MRCTSCFLSSSNRSWNTNYLFFYKYFHKVLLNYSTCYQRHRKSDWRSGDEQVTEETDNSDNSEENNGEQ
jgi:hypothetical protein